MQESNSEDDSQSESVSDDQENNSGNDNTANQDQQSSSVAGESSGTNEDNSSSQAQASVESDSNEQSNSTVGSEGGSVSVEDLKDTAIDVDLQVLDEIQNETIRLEVFELVQQALELDAENKELSEEVESLNSQIQKERQEFKSYKKQREDRMEQERKQYVKDVFTDVLDVHANLYRGLDSDHEDVESVKSGLEMTLNLFETALEDNGVEVILPDVGEKADPEVHDVITETPSDEVMSDRIVAVNTPGYLFEGSVIESASVVISE